MKKKKEQFEEEIVFHNVQEANEVFQDIALREPKQKIALILSGIGTAATLVSMIMGNPQGNTVVIVCFMLAQMAPLLGIISYILAGGFMDALKMAVKLGKIGWRIFPIPLFDLAVGFVTMIVSVAVFLYAPVLFVYMSVKRAKKLQLEAKNYLEAHGVFHPMPGYVEQTAAPVKPPKAENVTPVKIAGVENRTPDRIPVEHEAPFRVSVAEKHVQGRNMGMTPKAAAEEYQFCGFCGAKLKRKTRFCIVCGQKTED
ncbi:MAG: hypothetical protein MSA09_16210 [Lachnospiraceae bacterium]|nr:hypothetical protein [Lachnospiraceae bacterium]